MLPAPSLPRPTFSLLLGTRWWLVPMHLTPVPLAELEKPTLLRGPDTESEGTGVRSAPVLLWLGGCLPPAHNCPLA